MSKCRCCKHYTDCDEGWRFSEDADISPECFEPKATVFHQITASPEVLAEKLVYALYGTYGKTVIAYFSTIIPGKSWKEKSEAIAATVAKLKEVEK